MNQATASQTASVDLVFWVSMAISVTLLVLVTALMIYFVFRYSRRRHPNAEKVEGSTALEILWTVIPTVLVMVIFYFGMEEFHFLRTVPKDAMNVKVTGRMWDWAYEYPNGRRTDTLYVPVDRPVKLTLESVDVLHSFYIPAFRIKEDAVPGRQNYLWFKPQTMGPADVFCAEYCGQSHSYMISKVMVMSQKEFEEWYSGAPAAAAAAAPQPPALALLEKHDCIGCHTLDGIEGVGPTFKGIFGRTVVVVSGGKEQEAVIDEAYLRRAILEPDAEMVKGSTVNMPAPENLSDADLKIIIEYLKTLK